MRRDFLLAALVVASLAISEASASAVSLAKPKLGPWVASGAGFTLQKGTGRYRGKVVVTNFHMVANNGGCPEPFVTATVVGKFPVKIFTRGGYSTWGVGRNVGGEPEPMAAKILAGGQSLPGTFSLIFNFEHPSTSVLSGTVSFGQCNLYLAGARPKK